MEAEKYQAPCSKAKKCSGCQLQNLPYPRQLAHKQKQVQQLLGSFGSIASILPMENPLHYRNKIQAAFFTDRGGKVGSGVYQSATERVVGTNKCLLEDKAAAPILATIRTLCPSFRLQPYDLVTGRGNLRHVLIRRGFATKQIMVVLVTATPILPSKNNFTKALIKAHPEITTLIHTVNTTPTALLLGERETVLYGPGYIEDVLCDCTFRISARSFYQVNPVQTQQLYNRAIAAAKLQKTDRVVDAYCGIGTISLVAAKQAGEVLGVESNREAVSDAIQNAKRNQIKNARFFRADATAFLVDMAEKGEKADVVFLDPPRAGSTPAFLGAVAQLAPSRVIYISCNPETLARDLPHLINKGYVIDSMVPVDMFPFTHHVEMVVALHLQNR